MNTGGLAAAPQRDSYDVGIVGGAIMGSATAWFLTRNPDFNGSILVVERDPGYGSSSTAHTNSCMRQQFSTDLNIHISQFAADFVKNLRRHMDDDRVPELGIQNYGYMYLADNEGFADILRTNQSVQRAAGTETELLSRDEIAARYPFYHLDDIVLGSINLKDEGYWDGGTVFDWLRRSARERGVEYVAGEVVAMTREADRITSVTLGSGETVSCGTVVNASGPRAARTAAMAGIDVPVEPRKRFSWIFTAETPLDRDLPLTIDPSGVQFRQDIMDHDRWQDHVWPTIAARTPQFQAIRVVNEWAGHYAFNTLDQNAILGPHHEIGNFIFQNGFSGHGLQQSPAMGRGVSELIAYGEYRSLDLSPFSWDRIVENRPIVETAVI